MSFENAYLKSLCSTSVCTNERRGKKILQRRLAITEHAKRHYPLILLASLRSYSVANR